MTDAQWGALAGKRLRHGDETWELTGDVVVEDTGNTLGIEARRTDDVRHERAILRFSLEEPPASLNPGALDGHFERLERRGGDHRLVVGSAARNYRYALRGVEYR